MPTLHKIHLIEEPAQAGFVCVAAVSNRQAFPDTLGFVPQPNLLSNRQAFLTQALASPVHTL